MFRSLRFRLPALLIAGILLSGAVATAVSVRLYQGYYERLAIRELRREASGLATLYVTQMKQYLQVSGRKAPRFAGVFPSPKINA